MIASKITSRYAKALIDLSKDQNNLDACLKDMKLLKIACEENHDLSLLLKSPKYLLITLKNLSSIKKCVLSLPYDFLYFL